MPEKRASHAFWFVNSIVAAMVGLLILAVVWYAADLHGRRSGNANVNANHYAESAADDIEHGCPFTDPRLLSECIRGIIETTNESQRAEYELKAQIDVADWTFWTLIVAALGLGVTATGIWFVRENLLEMQRTREVSQAAVEAALQANAHAREANANAREMGEAQVRAYVTCIGGSRVDGVGIRIKLNLVNKGQSPAFDVSAKATLQVTRKTGALTRTPWGTFKFSYKDVVAKEPILCVGSGLEGSIELAWRERHSLSVYASDDMPNMKIFHLDVRGELTWRNVFDKIQTAPFRLLGSPERLQAETYRPVDDQQNA